MSYRIKSETLKAKRGSIYDKNLQPIATSTQSFNIGIYPDKVENIKEVSTLLSPLLEKDSTEIANKILNSSRFFYLDRNIEYKKLSFEGGTASLRSDLEVATAQIGQGIRTGGKSSRLVLKKEKKL